MKTLLVLEEAVKGINKATVLTVDAGCVNKVLICKSGRRGQINKSGALMCDSLEIIAMIKEHSEEINTTLSTHFGVEFKLTN